MSESLQVWVRNDKGQVYGPLSPPSVELLIDNGVIGGRLQVSTNGENYVFPGRVPGLRMLFPRETWGDTVVPGDELDAEWGKVVLPANLPGAPPASSPSGVAAAPAAGPGARAPMAGPGVRPAGPAAGPGARQQQGQRPMNPAQLSAQRPPGATPAPPPGAPRSSASVAAFMNNPAAPAAPASRPSVADFMNNPAGPAAPASRPSVAEFMNNPAGPAAPASRPSVAAFLNSPDAAAPVRSSTSGTFSAAPPAAPARAVAPAAAPPPRAASSGSGVRAVAPPASASGDAEMPGSGTLGAPHSAQHLYYLAAAGERTGLLTLVLADRELVIHFKKGNPEFLDSTHPEDSLDSFLLGQRLVTQAQLDQASGQLARFGGELLPALFGLGLVNPNAIFQHLGQRASQLLFRALTAEQGTFAFDLEELPAARSMPLGNKWAVYLEALRRVPGPDLKRRLMGAFDLPVMKAGGLVPASDLKLTPQEARALNYFDGVRSLAQLIQDLPGEADTIVRTAWMLAPLDLVSFAGVSQPAPRGAPPPPVAAPPPPKVVAPAPPVAAPAPARPAPVVTAPPQRPPPPVMAPTAAAPRPPTAAVPGNPTQMPKPANPYPGGVPPSRPPPPVMTPAAPKPPAAATPAGTADDVKQLQALHEAMKSKNYFDVLGVKRDADANAVKIAYLKAARSYHPDTVPPGSPEALAKVKADIFALIGEANRTLSDPALKADYVAELDAGGTGSKVDIEKILRAEEVFQKGRILIQARKYADGFKLFEEAISCNADEPEFYAWRGYARFLMAPDRKLATSEAMKDIKGCIEKNPNIAAAHYFAGFVAKTNGDMKTAQAEFKKTVQLDPKHIDAARELRNMK